MVSEKVKRPGADRVVSIMGATATGKTRLAMQLAGRFDAEIISMDSRQVYRGLDIGTAKPTAEERTRIPHHLVDVLDPGERHSAGRHLRLVNAALADIRARGKLPLVVGGTGLYFRVFFDGLIDPGISEERMAELRTTLSTRSTPDLYEELAACDPERADTLAPGDRVRIIRALEIYLSTGRPHSEHIRTQKRPAHASNRWPRVFLTCDRAQLRRRIAERTEVMYRAGWVAEVRALLQTGLTLDAPAMNSLGYRVIARALLEGQDPSDTQSRVVTLTQQYAKRQETFFRSVSDAIQLDIERDDLADRVSTLIRGSLGV